MRTCGIHGNATEPVPRCSQCDGLLPYWHELQVLDTVGQGSGWTCDLRIDTGSFRVWTARTTMADGEPYERTVYVEAHNDEMGGWEDCGHYDGDDPPRGLPGITPGALRGEVRAPDQETHERVYVASEVYGFSGELLIRVADDGTVSVAHRGHSWHAWGPPRDAEHRHG